MRNSIVELEAFARTAMGPNVECEVLKGVFWLCRAVLLDGAGVLGRRAAFELT